MLLRLLGQRKSDDCQVHGAPSRAANKTLLFMILSAFVLIVWHVWRFGPTGQPAVPEALAKPLPLLVGSEIWDMIFDRHGILAELWDVLPYFIVGILLAGYIRTYKIAVKMQASLRRYGFLSVFVASLVGILTPLCACGTVTTAVSLLFAGLPLAPVMSLMVTSPLMSPSTYLLTLNDLGPEWTVIRTVAALGMGVFAGIVTHLLRNKGFHSKAILTEGAAPRGDLHDENYPNERLRCNCREQFSHRVAARTKNTFVIFLAKSWEMLWLVGKYVLVGIAIGVVVERYMPREWVYGLFGRKNSLSVLWITLGSVPVFLHQISASSILYHIKSSLSGTLDGAAGLAFMIGGPVTAIPTMVMFWSIFRKRVFFLYMAVCIAGTLIISYAFHFLVFVPHVDMGNPLLKNVKTLSGGKASVIHKQGKYVRIVMDPDSKALIATYSDSLGTGGGVVFDAGFGRFLSDSTVRGDDGKYIQNIAEWLQQNSGSPGKRVLIYNTFHASGLDNDSFSRSLLPALEQEGFSVTITDRRATPKVTKELLASCNQLWVFFGESGQASHFSDTELEAISENAGDGMGMLLVAGKQGEKSSDMKAVNQLSSRYGVIYSGYAEHSEELSAGTVSHFLHRASATLGHVLKFVHKA